jgi:hypothetical protein
MAMSVFIHKVVNIDHFFYLFENKFTICYILWAGIAQSV